MQLIINLARIGNEGAGLKKFAFLFLSCLKKININFSVLKTESLKLDGMYNYIHSPSLLTIKSKISYGKPIAWFLFSLFKKFPNKKIISVTHHGFFSAKDQIITIHDLRPLFQPDSLLQKIYFSFFLKIIIKRCKAIFTVSNTSKKILLDTFNLKTEKIFVINNYLKTKDLSKVPLIPLNKRGKYLLSIGASWKHKNIHEFIHLHELWKNEYKLVILSNKSTYTDYLINLSNKLRLNNKIFFITNYIDDKALDNLYLNSSALIFPSTDEGFGLPPLEAMSLGTPVIASDIPIFREIYEDAPIYVKLGCRNSWNSAIASLHDINLLYQKTMLGFKQANKFTQEKTSSQLKNALYAIWPDLFG